MKKFLTILIMLALAGFISASAIEVSRGRNVYPDIIVPSILLFVINSLCSAYLYKKADRSKVEWALFGFLGNITAILYFWLFKDVLTNWKRGKRNFS